MKEQGRVHRELPTPNTWIKETHGTKRDHHNMRVLMIQVMGIRMVDDFRWKLRARSIYEIMRMDGFQMQQGTTWEIMKGGERWVQVIWLLYVSRILVTNI